MPCWAFPGQDWSVGLRHMLSGSDTVSGFLRRVSDLIRTCLYQVSCIRRGFRKVFARFSRGFRKVFARLSLPKYFRERFRRAEKKLINFCVPRGPPPRGAAEPGPPRHAKIGKNGSQKSLHAAVIKRGGGNILSI